MFAHVTAGGYSLVHLVIVAIIVCGVVAVGVIVIRAMGLNIPAWVVQIFWVVVAVVVGILAIHVIVSMVW